MNDLGYFVNRIHRFLLRALADGMAALLGRARVDGELWSRVCGCRAMAWGVDKSLCTR